MHRLGAAIAALSAVLVTIPTALDARVDRSDQLASKKAAQCEAADEVPLLGTLVQTHTDERVPLDERAPSPERLSALLADRVTGERHDFDPRLLDLLRALAKKHAGARIELVSGYRSAKLNEMMRKKGRHVASHSQHSLGHAIDFRIVADQDDAGATPPGQPRGLDPRIVEREIRDLGWDGGVGVYPLKSDWFVHADVGPRRRWDGN